MSSNTIRRDPFRSLLQLTASDLSTDERIRKAIEVGREHLGVDNGVLSYTGDGRYEVVETNIQRGPYAQGGVVDLDGTWCRHVVDDRETVGFADARDTEYRDDVALETTGLHCYVGAAVDIDGETYGTLCFSDAEPRGDPITDAERDFVAVLAEWVSNELERQKHYAELREQNERLDEFAGIVAHDLRNPLAGAIGFLELAQDQVSGQAAEFLDRVRGALGRMESMIAECLMLAKEGTDVGERTRVDLDGVVRDAWDTVRTRNATLSVEVAPGTTVLADEMRLRRLFENLFRNCVEHGGPDVAVTVTGDAHGFAVSDDGPGLPDDVEHALTAADADNIKSFGLGLLVVQRVISGHGWDLAVDSGDEGTRFAVSDVNAAEPVHEALRTD
ncbi:MULTISPECIES: GAF domain-containing sensor histidine kinase [unclassified Halorubrum]|uniref:sensor histidine kinase n=1 Tax=unclassified Halorubrum TaxID=2642239 RepID=UPI0010F62795|nr:MULTISPECIES: GAF domain-containing sensor histidine kinase [unclassified Halorubrum]TKX46027.1 sensor histidine kinase [Halorubrum sp. ARQ200]TKX50152.1 sensor histidine kinase [Halorubrum sp. ASP121]